MIDKEYILAEFIFETDEFKINGVKQLCLLQEEGNLTIISVGPQITVVKIESVYATLLKLQNSFLSDRMRISYIPDDLKDKYRSK